MRAWSHLLVTGLIGLVACGGGVNPSPSNRTTPLRAETSPAPPATATASARLPPPPLSATPVVSSPLTLTLWVPEDFATGAERGGDVLESQIAEFQARRPDIKLNYVLKAPYGKGGLADWLAQLRDLMPGQLPDAAIVDSRELDKLEQLGLLRPLNRDLASGAYWDLFASAQQLARRKGVWVSQPLTLETEQLVYDTRVVQTPPASWEQALGSGTPFAFAADSTDTFLLQYLQNGGSLTPTEHPALDAGVMQAILDYYQRARANNILNENAAMLKSAREVLPLFLTAQAPMAQVRARDFLTERARLPNAAAAPIPTRDGKAAALVSSWSFVILSDDAARQRAAAQYLEWLDDPAQLAPWASAARMIPARKSAFAQAIQPPAYAEVLWLLLEQGIPSPTFNQQSAYANAWHTAVQAVLNGQLGPDDAAVRAIQTLSQ